MELKNLMDKYRVCVLKGDGAIVRYQRFVKTIFCFLNGHHENTGKPITNNLKDQLQLFA